MIGVSGLRGLRSRTTGTLKCAACFDGLQPYFRFRYFNIGGTHFSSTPIKFNGAIIPGGRTNNFDSWEWFSGGLYYERRLTPLYQKYEGGWPTVLRGWDLRGRIGIEFTYLDFSINGGSTPTKLTPGGEETKE